MNCHPAAHVALLVVWGMAMLIEPPRSLADGGAVQLRESAGPFLITVFTEPAVLRVGPLDISVLVQRQDTSDVVFDAEVSLLLFSPPGVAIPAGEVFCGPDGTPLRAALQGDSAGSPAIRATREKATNKLLYAAKVELHAAGIWRMRVWIRHGGESASVETSLPVVAARGGLLAVWPYLVMPFVLTGLFAVHQKLKHRLRNSRDAG